MDDYTAWYTAEEGEVHSDLFDYVSEVESVQSDVFTRFVALACLYDPNDREGSIGATWERGSGPFSGPDGYVSENLIASNVDTVASIIAPNQPRARFMTDDGDWSTQRRARRLEFYAEGLVKKLDVYNHTTRAFKDAALKGTGMIKVFPDHDSKKICVERVLIDDIIVDEAECRTGKPMQMHHRLFVSKEALKARFPDHEEEIERAQSGTSGTESWRRWTDHRPMERDVIVAVESWKLPIGCKGTDAYVPGRWTVCVDGADLQDEKYHEDRFPFARIVWSDRTTGWYGLGLAERITGHQRTLNKLHWQIDRQLDQHAVPTTYVSQADARLAVVNTNRAGTIVPIKGRPPVTVIPHAVSPETYQRAQVVKDSSYEESGVSRLAATSKKPGGLDSGAALREYRDQTTQRFAIQEQAYEQLVLDVIWLVLSAAKDLGKDAPVIWHKARSGVKKIEWAKVHMSDVKLSMAAASTISRTPAGRMQTVLEWAQAGIVSQDEARRLMSHPDLERSMSLYNAALEDIERCIEEVLEGEQLVPEPYQNLKMGVWRFQMAYLKAVADGAPEEVLESLRQWITQAAFVLVPRPQAPGPLMSGVEAPLDPNTGMPGGMPEAPMQDPMAPQIPM